MKRINVMVSDPAKDVLVKYQRKHKLSTLDEAEDQLLLAVEKMVEQGII